MDAPAAPYPLQKRSIFSSTWSDCSTRELLPLIMRSGSPAICQINLLFSGRTVRRRLHYYRLDPVRLPEAQDRYGWEKPEGLIARPPLNRTTATVLAIVSVLSMLAFVLIAAA